MQGPGQENGVQLLPARTPPPGAATTQARKAFQAEWGLPIPRRGRGGAARPL